MAGFDPFQPTHVIALATAWVALFALAVVLGWSGRRRARGHLLPTDMPAYLDTYGLACLAGGATRLRDAALAGLVARGVVQFGRPGEAVFSVGDLSADAHPVEAALHEAVLRARPGDVVHAASVASARLAVGYRRELRRQDLLVRPDRGLALVPAMLVWPLALTLSILAVIAVSRDPPPAPPGYTDPKGWVVTLTVVFGLGICVCGLGWMLTGMTLYRNRRGDKVLAEAVRSGKWLDPAVERDWSDFTPSEEALSVALFGLVSPEGDRPFPWAGQPVGRLRLRAVLYPLRESSGGG